MCLAVPGKIVEQRGTDAVVDLQGNRLNISTVITPEAAVGEWVLVHAGFAIAQLTEHDALETWDYLRQAFDDPFSEAIDAPPAPPPGGPP